MTIDDVFGKELKNRITPVKVVVDECGFVQKQHGPQRIYEKTYGKCARDNFQIKETSGCLVAVAFGPDAIPSLHGYPWSRQEAVPSLGKPSGGHTVVL